MQQYSLPFSYNMPRIASELRKPIKFCLFVASYAPLFLLIALTRLFMGSAFLHWGGVSKNSVLLAVKEFWLVYVLLLITISCGILLASFLTDFTRRVTQNGSRVKVVDIQNKNSETIGYISTYLVPLFFKDFADAYSVIVLVVLLFVVWQLYVNSSLLGVNPVLNLVGYSLYEVTFDDRPSQESAPRTRNGLVLIRSVDVQEDDWLVLKRIGHKLYFAVVPNA
jgi:hypothetical protein